MPKSIVAQSAEGTYNENKITSKYINLQFQLQQFQILINRLKKLNDRPFESEQESPIDNNPLSTLYTGELLFYMNSSQSLSHALSDAIECNKQVTETMNELKDFIHGNKDHQ